MPVTAFEAGASRKLRWYRDDSPSVSFGSWRAFVFGKEKNMKRIHITALSLVSAVSVLALSIAACAVEPSGNYPFEAQCFTYYGEQASFSTDLPVFTADSYEPGDGSSREVGDGSTEWQLFNTLWEGGSITCAFHQSELGFDGEAAAWENMDDVVQYSVKDADGMPLNVVGMSFYGYNSYIAEMPWDDGTWINITVTVPEDKMEEYRDDMLSMFGTFTRLDPASAGQSAEETAEITAESTETETADITDEAESSDTAEYDGGDTAESGSMDGVKGSPDTGAGSAAVFAGLAAAAAGAIFLTGKSR